MIINMKLNTKQIVSIADANQDFSRVGLAVAAGEMKYQELLEWICENEV